jgi:hypothetical protein
MRILSKDDVVPRLKRVIDTKKVIITIIWNPHGFHGIGLLADGAKFNSACFLDNVMAALQLRISPAARKDRKERYHFTPTTVSSAARRGVKSFSKEIRRRPLSFHIPRILHPVVVAFTHVKRKA